MSIDRGNCIFRKTILRRSIVETVSLISKCPIWKGKELYLSVKSPSAEALTGSIPRFAHKTIRLQSDSPTHLTKERNPSKYSVSKLS